MPSSAPPILAGLATSNYRQLLLSNLSLRSFPYSRNINIKHNCIKYLDQRVNRGTQALSAILKSTSKFHTLIDTMPPKKATLGYVKSRQRTLGCMLLAHVYRPTTANGHVESRKYFHPPTRASNNPQQSTLAFQNPKSTKKEEIAETNDTQVSEESKEPTDEDVDELQVTNGSQKSDQSENSTDKDADEDVEMGEGAKPGGVIADNALKGRRSNGEDRTGSTDAASSLPSPSSSLRKRSKEEADDDDDDEPFRKRSRVNATQEKVRQSVKMESTKRMKQPAEAMTPKNKSQTAVPSPKSAPKAKTLTAPKPSLVKKNGLIGAVNGQAVAGLVDADVDAQDPTTSEAEDEEAESDEEEKPEVAAKAREKVQSTLRSSSKDPYPDWKPGEPVPYAALCTTFSLIEMTSKRLVISAHCSLFLRQVLRLTPQDLLPTIQLMINKLAADYAGVELGIGESLIMKAIGESTGRSLQVIKSDQNEIGDLGLVAAKSRSNQPTMFKPKPLTVRGVLEGLMSIATVSGDGSQGRKIAGIKKLLSAADAAHAGKGSKGIDITKDKGGASEAKFIIRFLEGKLRLGLAEKTVLVALAHAMVIHETERSGNKLPSSDKLAEGEAMLKTVYR